MLIRQAVPAFAQTALRPRHKIATKPASLIFLKLPLSLSYHSPAGMLSNFN
jgi:hypothetical protein